MELKIEFQSEDEDFALAQTRSLREWLINEESLSEVKVTQELTPIKEGEAGADLLTVLQIVLSAGLIGELSKIVQVWIQERSKRLADKSPELKLSVTKPDGTKFEIDTKNVGDIEKSLIEKLS
jgi:hypothetical protein